MLKFSTFFFAFSLIPIATNSQTVGQWFTDSRSGCKIWDETPQPLQSIKFEGTCTKKLAQGQGKVTFFKNGLFDQAWDANWIDGKAVGKLTITYIDGGKYYGELLNGEKNGQGSITYANGDAYEGDFKNGKFHGNGNYSKKNGWRYSGQFDKEQFNGKGTYIYADGSKYVGDFRDSQFNGNGIYYDTNGVVKASGQFENGEFIPPVTLSKLETIAECYGATAMIEADFIIRGDYKNEQNSKKVKQFLFDRFYFYARIYTRKMPVELSRSTFELLDNSVKKYTYMDDRAQMNYAMSVSKNANCLEQAR
jgi:hypothetical protein